MEKRHQIFVSSTYQDLQEERREIINAILELECMPAGMELFPAADEDSWNLIKRVIDDSDYYIVVIAGKYGSLNSDGVSYTEMEYDYALSKAKPIIAFIHSNIGDLKSSSCESTTTKKKKLEKFTEKVKLKICKYWDNASDLGGKVSRSLVNLRRDRPSEGWIKGRYAADTKMLQEYETMRAKLAKLEVEDLVGRDTPPPDAENYEGGSNEYKIEVKFSVNKDGDEKRINLFASWDKIFSYCGSSLANECDDDELERKIKLVYWHSVPERYTKFNSNDDLIIPYVFLDQIKVQLQALGFISPGIKKRAVSDTHTYWQMTPYGEKYLIQIKAIRRKKPE